tara:strand:+ start:272 stop:529 length:258 start_codon:yes stop_codon:yes gene_type:complete
MAQFQDLQLGFDRTQLYKEHIQPQINRTAALRAVLDFSKMNQIKLTTKELIKMTERYIQFIETGDKSWVELVDNYLLAKYDEDNI